jgi:hypothetical protein
MQYTKTSSKNILQIVPFSQVGIGEFVLEGQPSLQEASTRLVYHPPWQTTASAAQILRPPSGQLWLDRGDWGTTGLRRPRANFALRARNMPHSTDAARAELASPVEKHCGGEVSWSMVDRDHPWALME